MDTCVQYDDVVSAPTRSPTASCPTTRLSAAHLVLPQLFQLCVSIAASSLELAPTQFFLHSRYALK